MLPPPYKAPKLVLARDASVHALARAAIQSCSRQVRRNSRGARIGKDPDYAHQLRVGARRMRVCLRLFAKLLEPGHTHAIEDELRWVFRRVGAMRDYDVLLADVVSPLRASAPSEALDALAAELEKERAHFAEIARRTLASRRYVRLLRTLRALPSALALRKRGKKRARPWARKRLERRLQSVLALRDAAFGSDEVARHELRKELKKLRYTADLVRGLWDPKEVKGYLAQLSELQDVLGALNDVAVGRGLLLPEQDESLDDTKREAIAVCVRALDARGAEQLPKLGPAFSAFEQAVPYWRSSSR